MTQVIIAFGVLFVLLGFAAVLRPGKLIQIAHKVTVQTWLRVLAFALRVGIGVILLLAAPSTMFPLPVKLIGVLLIVSGILVLAIGNQGVQRIVSWTLGLGVPAVVTGGVLGIALGAFLIYAAL
jgi:hypothetical protein